MDDGYYLAETPDTMMFDSGGYDPADPLYSDWHELWPQYCDDWTLESWVDNGDGVLSASDQIDMNNTDNPGEHLDFHVDWVNPTPIPNDGKTDVVLTISEVAPDLSIEGVVLPYIGAVPLIYPTPEPGIYYVINVTVTNQGTAEAGSFNVSFTVHLEGEIIPEHGRKETVESLQQGANENLLFDWNPQEYGNYTLTIAADSDNDITELDETNNVRSRWVIGTIRGDIDGDGYVGSADFSALAGLYGIGFPFPPYPTVDINWDGYVGSADFSMLAATYGQSI
jgi:hypothetical protein